MQEFIQEMGGFFFVRLFLVCIWQKEQLPL